MEETGSGHGKGNPARPAGAWQSSLGEVVLVCTQLVTKGPPGTAWTDTHQKLFQPN